MARLTVPIVACVIGEGGSGGAIAIALADRVLMQENAIYSVISPEGCAAILWRDAGEAKKAAAAFKPDAAHCLELGVIDAIVPEPEGGAHTDPTRRPASWGSPCGRRSTTWRTSLADELRRRRRPSFGRSASSPSQVSVGSSGAYPQRPQAYPRRRRLLQNVVSNTARGR